LPAAEAEQNLPKAKGGFHMSKSVAEVMTANPRTVSRQDSVVGAAKIMLEEDVGSVPIAEDGYLLGIVTDRDIALRVVAAGRDPQTVRVDEIATPEPHYASPDESVDDAYERMSIWRVRRLPVVDGDRLIGMLAQADLVHELKDKKAGQLVDEISQPGHVPYALGRREVGID
jgi:CBS domain-containing protein